MANGQRKEKVTAEHIANLPDRSGRIFRIRAPGGWIVIGSLLCTDRDGNVSSMALTFVPDDTGAWMAEEGSDD
ncbi:MAG: hypothetical protein IPG63_14725 [Xanthomonadales bacterium]|nr:hypothetical protein [Xanthomonadales bacterium]